MKYKDRVIRDLDGVSNSLESIIRQLENQSIDVNTLTNNLKRLHTIVEQTSDRVGLESDDFSLLRNGVN